MDINGTIYCSRCMRLLPASGPCPHCGYDPDAQPFSDVALEEGTLLNGRYQLGARIASGGFGITYAAWDEILCIPMVVKEYFPADFAERDTRESDELLPRPERQTEFLLGLRRFLRESRVLAMLEQIPGIVRVYDSFEANGTAYIAMEYVHGVTLDEYVRQNRPSPRALFAMLRQTIDALAMVHRQGVLHRDIKPQNLLVQGDGSIKLIDFGSASEEGRESRSILVTRHYAPIEQYGSDQKQGPWTDVYSLCATMYEALTGQRPPDSVARQVRDELVPPERRGVRLRRRERRALLGGLEVLPQRRIQSMEELRSILYGLPMPEEVQRRKRFARRVLLAAALIVALAVLATVNIAHGLPLGGGLLYSLFPDGFHLRGRWAEASEVEIPASLLGIPVTRIESGALRGDGVLVRLTVPESVREVESFAFSDCAQLAQVTLEPGVERIGDYAFAGCSSLHTAHVPASVSRIGESAFAGCDPYLMLWGERGSYAEAYQRQRALGDAAQEEDDAPPPACAFTGEGEYAYTVANGEVTITGYLGGEESIAVPSYIDGLPVTDIASGSEDDPTFPGRPSGIALPQHLRILRENVLDSYYLHEVRLNPELEELGPHCLGSAKLDRLELPEGLRVIGEFAFSFATLEQIELPDSLERIGDDAFFSSALTSIRVPAGVRELGESAFYSCDQLKAAVIEAPLELLPESTFSQCPALESVSLPDGLARIDSFAFWGCTSLRGIALPASIREVGSHAFWDCSALEYLCLPSADVIENGAFENCGSLRLLYLGAGRIALEDIQHLDFAEHYGTGDVLQDTFVGCSNELVIAGPGGSDAERIAGVFDFRYEDSSLWLRGARFASGELSIPRDAGLDAALERCALPTVCAEADGRMEPVRAIGPIRDLGARVLELPLCLEEIGEEAFVDSGDIEVVRAERLSRIGDRAFFGSAALRAIDLPEGLTEIGEAAFAYCAALDGIALPSTLARLGESAFYNCASLTEIELPESLVELPNNCFGGTGLTSVHVPGSVTTCKMAFANCKSLESATLAHGVRYLTSTFVGCERLRTVVLPDTLRQINCSAFEGCAALEDVWIYSMDADLYFSTYELYREYRNPDLPHFWLSSDAAFDDILMDLFEGCPNVTIHAYPGSSAEAYATEHGLKFEPIAD